MEKDFPITNAVKNKEMTDLINIMRIKNPLKGSNKSIRKCSSLKLTYKLVRNHSKRKVEKTVHKREIKIANKHRKKHNILYSQKC